MTVPQERIRVVRAAPLRQQGAYVLYWMTAARRTTYNFALQRAVSVAEQLGCSLVVLEALRSDYPWASDRVHAFVMQGMRDNSEAFASTPVMYYPHVATETEGGKGLLVAMANNAAVVITDDYPCFFLPRMLARAEQVVPVRLEAVDSNGLYPMRAADRIFTTAASFRRHLQKQLPQHFAEFPRPNALDGVDLPPYQIPASVLRQWPMAGVGGLEAEMVASLKVDHSVPVVAQRGGSRRAARLLEDFLAQRLAHYADRRNQPEVQAHSSLSPYLHFGHLSSHEVFVRLMQREQWSPDRISDKVTGARSGWWGASAAAEAFLDQLITWRELGFNMCALRSDYDSYETLPEWALQTLDKHSKDRREYVYSIDQFERAATHDPLWNAAQRQLLRDGVIHSYLRMLWGKKIVEWTRRPQDALEMMVELNNKYALDGRDPNSYGGIFWVLGRYDRPWGPERPIFGKVRYMSSQNTARKVRVAGYIQRFSA